MKLIDKSALVAEIEKRIKEREEEEKKGWAYSRVKIVECEHILSFIDTLEVKDLREEPVSEDLEKAAIEYCGGNKGSDARVRTGFIIGAEWQKQQMMAKAVETTFNVSLSSSLYDKLWIKGCKEGDKLLVIKKDEL